MKVYLPTHLLSYTGQKSEITAEGSTLTELLSDRDRQYPGFRFRVINEQDLIREHIKIFINQDQVRDLRTTLRPDDEIQIICAISGGS